MANRKLDKLLAKAVRAYEKGDRRTGSKLANQILQSDFHHEGVWQLLYRTYGSGKPFNEFQRDFTEKYYPDKRHLLDEQAGPGPAPAKGKSAFFGRLFGALRRRLKPGEPTPEETTPQPAQLPQDSMPPQPARQPETVSRVVLQPTRREGPKESQPSPSPATPTPPPGPAPDLSLPAYSRPRPSPATTATETPESGKIRVMVVDDINETRESVIRALRFEEDIDVVAVADNGSQAIELARQNDPDVIVMDVNMPDMDGLTATAHIRRLLPATQVIILTVQDDIDYMRQAMMAGARDFLAKPPTIEDLVAAVQSAYKYTRQERAKAPPVPGAPKQMVTVSPKNRLITVYSPRGGAGCTLLATNLAISLHSEETPVVVVDGNLQFGDIPVLFNVQTKLNLLDLTARADELDNDLVEEILADHDSGVRLLAPPRPEYAERVSSAQFSRVLNFLKNRYAYVIVDTGHRLENITLAAFDVSDLVVLITTQDIPSIARLRHFLDLASLLKIDPQRIFAVMNQYDPRVGISPERVGETFKHKISATIPKDPEVVLPSINRGAPFMLHKDMRSKPIAQAVGELATMILERIDQLEQAEPVIEA